MGDALRHTTQAQSRPWLAGDPAEYRISSYKASSLLHATCHSYHLQQRS